MNIRNFILVVLTALLLSLRTACATPAASSDPVITFRPGNDILYPDYKQNKPSLESLESTIDRYANAILAGQGHIRLIACVAPAEKDDPVAINIAAIRAAVVRTHLCHIHKSLAKSDFAFFLSTDTSCGSYSVRVACLPGPVPADAPDDIYYSPRNNNVAAIRAVLSKYGVLPFVSPDTQEPPPAIAPMAESRANGDGTQVAIYYRRDKWALDSLYLSNRKNLHLLDSILTTACAQRCVDTLTITAFASPEGDSDHNMRLSQRRAVTLQDYIAGRYPSIDRGQIVTRARGVNWEGMEKLAFNDPNLPSKEKVLGILHSSMNEQQKQEALTKLDGGKTYYHYILPNYYTFLRVGAMVLVNFAPADTVPPLPVTEPAALPEPAATPMPSVQPVQPLSESALPPAPAAQSRAPEYPLALKTNLLYDLAGAANLGVEIPLGGNWSLIGDAAYAYWRTSGHLYALQTLEYGLSGRYWLPVSPARKARNTEWAKPLRGWNFGVYTRYWQRYDVQWQDGVQGDGSWSVGVTAGYAFPIGRNLSLEAGLGAGYFSTSQYRTYDRPRYDAQGDYHLMWRETGKWKGFMLTKANFSLVWLLETNRTWKR